MHDCLLCGCACYCNGDWDDFDTGPNSKCSGCGCEEDDDHWDDYDDDWDDDEPDFPEEEGGITIDRELLQDFLENYHPIEEDPKNSES